MTPTAPALIVVLPLEGRPKVIACWGSDAEERRLADWLDSQPALGELVERALELAEQAQAA